MGATAREEEIGEPPEVSGEIRLNHCTRERSPSEIAGRMEDLRNPRKYLSDNSFCFVQAFAWFSKLDTKISIFFT